MPSTPLALSAAAVNERIKLTANLLNTLASSSIVVGGITPIAAIAFGIQAGPTREPAVGLAVSAAFVAVGIILHSIAREHLKRLT